MKKQNRTKTPVTQQTVAEPEKQAEEKLPTSKVTISVVAGKVDLPRVEGDPLKKKDVKLSLSLAEQFAIQKMFAAHKGDRF